MSEHVNFYITADAKAAMRVFRAFREDVRRRSDDDPEPPIFDY